MKILLCIVCVVLIWASEVTADNGQDEAWMAKQQAALNAASSTIGATVAAAAKPTSNAAATQTAQAYAKTAIDRSYSLKAVNAGNTGARKLLQHAALNGGI